MAETYAILKVKLELDDDDEIGLVIENLVDILTESYTKVIGVVPMATGL